MKRRNFIQLVIARVPVLRWKSLFSAFQTNQSLILRREPDNFADKNAIALYWQDQKLGYIPRTDNVVIAQLMDKGEQLGARMTDLSLSSNPWERVGIGVYFAGVVGE